MLKKMKWRFILSAMAAMTAVVAVLLAVVNLWNYKETTRRVDQILAAVMDAEQTGGEPFAGRDFPPETPFTARFFSVRTDGTEERTEVILDNISSVSEEEAREYAREVLEEGKNSGYYKSYRYRAEEQEGETTLLFLDVSNELQFIQTLLFSSCIVAAASLLSVFGLLAIFSGRAVAPYARNIERQKQFITDAGHEIKTPLTSISTSADVLAMEQEDNEWVRNIKKQSARLSRLVTDLVTLSRLDEERPIPEPVRFSVSDTAWEIAEPFAALARAKEKRFSCSIEEELYMTGDQGVMLSGTFYQPFLFQIPQNKRTPRVNDSDGFSRTFFYPGGIYAMIGFCNHKNGSRTLPDQSSVSASFHHMDAGPAIHPCPLLMITVETQNFNLISQDFYDKTVFSLDLALIPCTCGHAGCLIWHGSYHRKVILEDSVLSLRISRVRCRYCGCTHAILLSSIVPYSQIPLSIHVSVAQCCENRGSLSSVLHRQTYLDENHISSLARSYRSHWQERLRAISARTSSLRDLVRTCFAVFSRQFMQIKTTRNKLFLLPT